MEYSVAVVIPTLNEEKFIESCLQSIIYQTFPFEKMDVMVVDGGSEDRTRDIVSRMSKEYSNIRLIDNPGKIQSIAFNIGVKESAAPYIVRLDAHATYNSVYIEKCLEIFSADAEFLGCQPELVGNVGGVCAIRPQHSGLIAESSAILNRSKFGIGGAAFRVGAPAGFVDTVPFGCFPRKLIEKIGGMREDLARGEDNEFNNRIRRAGYKIYLDPQIVCTYFSRDTLKGNMKQMYANGESIGHLFYVDRSAIGLRHLIPLLFVTSVIAGIVMSLIFPLFVYLVGAELALYFFCDATASFMAVREYGYKFLFSLFLLFFCVHISYGVGTIIGFFTGRKFIK